MIYHTWWYDLLVDIITRQKSITCLTCKESFRTKPYRINIAKYCSFECYWESLKGVKKAPFSEAHKRNISIGKTGKKRTDTPWNKGKKFPELSGENSHNWRGGITPINKLIRNSPEYILWRTAVFSRDNFTCVQCGKRGVVLNADHIKPFVLYPELRLAIDNGRTLCVPCHKKTDNFAGRGIKRLNYIRKIK